MIVTDWIKKLTDIIMPYESQEEYDEPKETKETKKAEAPVEELKIVKETPQSAQPAAQSFQAEKQSIGIGQGFGGSSMSFTRRGGTVVTSDTGVTSMDGVHFEAYNNGNSDPSVRPSLAVVKTPQLTMKIYAPTKYDDQVKQIADDLLKHNAVIVNFEGVDDVEQQRIGDFVIGAVYMIDGRAEMVSSKIVLYVPKGIDYESAAAKIPMRRYN